MIDSNGNINITMIFSISLTVPSLLMIAQDNDTSWCGIEPLTVITSVQFFYDFSITYY